MFLMIAHSSGHAKLSCLASRASSGLTANTYTIGLLYGTSSIVVPVSVRPIPMAPVGSLVMRIAVRAIVITARVIRRPVKDRNRDRYWQTEREEEDSSLRIGLSQQRDSKAHRQNDNKFFHIVTFYRRKPLIAGYATQQRDRIRVSSGGVGLGNPDGTKALMLQGIANQEFYRIPFPSLTVRPAPWAPPVCRAQPILS
jgi:hypothetical protein